MNRREREALDRHITGNYGEDQLRNFCPDCGAKFDLELVVREANLDDNDADEVETCLPCYRKRRENEIEEYIAGEDRKKESHPDDWTPRPKNPRHV